MEPVAQQQLHAAAAAGNDAPAAAADRLVCICTAGADAGDEERICNCTDKRDWQNMPPELVYKVADIVLRSEVRGYFRLRAVCKAWRSAAI